MDTTGNEHALFFADVTELAGEAEHERVTELEVIFAHYQTIDAHALRRCANLQKLTLINGRMQRVPSLALQAVRESLVHLCLSAQQIAHMDALDLPNLRSLYLQQNRIERMEGLEKCRRLQVLWLYGNRIRRIEGLHQCTDLRELWLQDNMIQSLSGTASDPALQHLVNLESLCLAKNRVRHIDDVQALSKLVSLRSLVLIDEHFGSNPVVRHPEYRVIAIASLRQLQYLDGTHVEDSERAGAVDQFLHQALAFNDIVTDLTLNFEQELRAIQTRKERGHSNAEMMQRELVEALNEVEQLIARGVVELEEEKQRQIRLREYHTAQTVDAMKSIHQRYSEALNREMEENLKIVDEEVMLYEVLEQEAAAEHSLNLTLSTLQCTAPMSIAVETLSETSADYVHIATRIDPVTEQGPVDKYRVLQVHRFYHIDLVNKFERSLIRQSENPGAGSANFLFCVVNEDDIIGILQNGFTGDQGGSTPKWLVLFSNPLQALQFSEGSPGSVAESVDNDADQFAPIVEVPRIRSHVLLMCQVFMVHVSRVTIGDVTVKQLGSLSSVVSLATAAASTSACEHQQHFLQTSICTSQRSGEIFIVNRDEGLPNVLPQFVVLCTQRLAPHSLPDRSNSIAECSQPEHLLASLSRDLEEEVGNHQDRLWRELDPDIWIKKSQAQKDRNRMDDDISLIKNHIGEEKKIQKRLLKAGKLRN